MESMIFQLTMGDAGLRWITCTISSEKMIALRERKKILKTLKLRRSKTLYFSLKRRKKGLLPQRRWYKFPNMSIQSI